MLLSGIQGRAFSLLLFSLLFHSPIASANIREGLVGWWKLDETSGTTAIDWSGKNHNGTYTGTTALTAAQCKRGACRYFNGVGDQINFGVVNNLDIPGSFTFSGWIKVSNRASHYIVFAKGPKDSGHYEVFIQQGTGLICAYHPDLNAVAACGTVAHDDGAWHLFVITYDGSNEKFFVDNILENTVATTGSIVAEMEQFTIGELIDGTLHFYGSIDDVRIYNRALSAQEVSDLFRAGTLIRNAKISNARFNQ